MPKITAFNKIGFHAGPAGNHTGIGDYYRKLDEAGVPFVIKSVDHYGHIFEATQYRNADHVFCYRLSSFGQPGDFNFDVPDYSLSPKLAAKKQWQHMEERLPSEYDRSKVWIEPINEIDKERCDWLGEFACEFGEIALKEDLKVMQFGWSSGEPDREGWETPGMISYFRMCEQHPDRLGVSLHEYSYVTDEIWRLRGDLVGRFKLLFDVCDEHNIARPKVIMSEWGWAYQKVPPPHVAMQHIREVNELYAEYPAILGAAIWYLGSGYASIHNLTQRLIAPVIDLSLAERYTVEQNMPSAAIPAPELGSNDRVMPILIAEPTPTGDPTVRTPEPAPARVQEKPSNVAYVADVSIPDDVNIEAGTAITKTWRVRNTGQTSWGDGFKLVFISGNPMGDTMAVDVPSTSPGGIAEISVSMRAPTQKEGTVFGDWRMVTPSGNQFGDVLYIRITVIPKIDGVDNLVFAADVTVPDDSEIEGGQAFTKTWRVRNNGDTTWRAGYKLTFVGGASMASVESVELPATRPGQTAEVSIPMTAPVTPGVHWSDFRPQNSRGEFFGDIVYVRIVVPQPINIGGRISPLSQNDPQWKGTQLGDTRSDVTIGEWGCLLACLTMVANGYGKGINPNQLNDKLNRKRLYINHKETPYNALSKVYSDVKYSGRIMGKNNPNLINSIDASLRAGNPVPVQVDYTPNSAYTPNDQHWVLIVGRAGDDYRINDPWIYPNVETSFKVRYARPGQLIKDSIISALFYQSTRPQEALPVAGTGVLSAEATESDASMKVDQDFRMLSTGLNIDPALPNCNPHNEDTLKGLDWVRFVYKISGQPDPEDRSLKAAFKIYDESVRDYHRRGTGSIIVLNQETMWGMAPWANNGDWNAYATQFAKVAGQIARRYRRMDDLLAFEIWHKQDQSNAEAPVPAADYATLLTQTAAEIRKAAPNAKILAGGLVSGSSVAVGYMQSVASAAGELPIDGIAIQPYGRWGTRAPFDWGETFPPINELVDRFEAAFPNLPLWITEIGVASSEPIDPVYNDAIGKYMLDFYQHISIRYSKRVPVVTWYAYSDLMNQAGVFDFNGMPKIGAGDAFNKVINKEFK